MTLYSMERRPYRAPFLRSVYTTIFVLAAPTAVLCSLIFLPAAGLAELVHSSHDQGHRHHARKFVAAASDIPLPPSHTGEPYADIIKRDPPTDTDVENHPSFQAISSFSLPVAAPIVRFASYINRGAYSHLIQVFTPDAEFQVYAFDSLFANKVWSRAPQIQQELENYFGDYEAALTQVQDGNSIDLQYGDNLLERTSLTNFTLNLTGYNADSAVASTSASGTFVDVLHADERRSGVWRIRSRVMKFTTAWTGPLVTHIDFFPNNPTNAIPALTRRYDNGIPAYRPVLPQRDPSLPWTIPACPPDQPKYDLLNIPLSLFPHPFAASFSAWTWAAEPTPDDSSSTPLVIDEGPVAITSPQNWVSNATGVWTLGDLLTYVLTTTDNLSPVLGLYPEQRCFPGADEPLADLLRRTVSWVVGRRFSRVAVFDQDGGLKVTGGTQRVWAGKETGSVGDLVRGVLQEGLGLWHSIVVDWTERAD